MKTNNYNSLLFFLIVTILLSVSCGQEQNNSNSEKIDSTQIITIIPPSQTYYPTQPDSTCLIIAKPIIYDVQTKNYNPDDEWKAECLKNCDTKVLINELFQAVYKQKLIAVDFQTEQELSIDSIKSLEKMYSRDRVGTLQFEEEWFYDQNKSSFYKKVKSVIMGYELFDQEGELRGFAAGIKVILK